MLKIRDLERLKMKCIEEEGSNCLIWAGSTSPMKFPYFNIDGKTCYAHRVLWWHHYGDIPEGKAVGRKCGKKNCMNIVHFHLTRKFNLDSFGEYNRARKLNRGVENEN